MPLFGTRNTFPHCYTLINITESVTTERFQAQSEMHHQIGFLSILSTHEPSFHSLSSLLIFTLSLYLFFSYLLSDLLCLTHDKYVTVCEKLSAGCVKMFFRCTSKHLIIKLKLKKNMLIVILWRSIFTRTVSIVIADYWIVVSYDYNISIFV